jgi:toluene monooxygenase system ferredoxin subunit
VTGSTSTTTTSSDGDIAGVKVGKEKFLLCRSNDELHAFVDACPHKGTPLSDGDLDDGILTCNIHLWEFDVATGDSVNPCGEKLTSCPVRVSGGRIEIQPVKG